ncbi:CvpA family protein [uncultured Eubacterium sp.]|uniref:CvpA family protein n=1 Tax=uncultured Eubacterium sp. TaxID=165185 RepID=UPI002805ED85|nr:CvpA family protein [uncultured Eubacterium sp.]
MTIFNYTVNYVDVVIVGVLLLAFFVGYSKGIFITLVNLIRYSVGLFLCMFVTNEYYQIVYDSFVQDKIVNSLSQKVVTTANIDEILSNLNSTIDTLPSFIKDGINLSSLSFSSGDDVAAVIADNVFMPVALILVKAALFLLTFIVFFGATGLVIRLIRNRNKKKRNEKGGKSTIKGIDRVLGGVFGIVKGALIVFIFVSAVSGASQIDGFRDNAVINTALNSSIYNWLVNINPFNLITEGII